MYYWYLICLFCTCSCETDSKQPTIVAGAMENWGLVTYRESYLLVDTENTATVRKQWIALVVGHELAHQWFGNLVTMVS